MSHALRGGEGRKESRCEAWREVCGSEVVRGGVLQVKGRVLVLVRG